MASPGRNTVVPSTSRLCSPALHHHPRLLSLRQLLQRRTVSNPSCNGHPNPLHRSRWYHRSHHVVLHALNVHHRSSSDPSAILRNLLVHPPSFHPLPPGPLHPRHRLLRARHRPPLLTLCRQELLEPLHRLRRLALGTLGRRSLPHRTVIPGSQGAPRNRNHQSRPSPIRRDGDPVPQTQHEIQGRPMALPASALSLESTMAPFHHHLVPLRPVHLGARTPGGRLHALTRRRARLRAVPSQRIRRP